MDSKANICPHCGQEMKKWATPEMANWAAEFQFVCFNDECPYYIKGWSWMLSQFNVKASYRHRFNPQTGEKGPLPVWSKEALKNGIVEE